LTFPREGYRGRRFNKEGGGGGGGEKKDGKDWTGGQEEDGGRERGVGGEGRDESKKVVKNVGHFNTTTSNGDVFRCKRSEFAFSSLFVACLSTISNMV